jgi:hypothetical protein
MSLEGLDVLAPVLGTADGLKLVASLFQFVRKRYGMEKSRLSETELGNIVASLGVKDLASSARLADSVWFLEEQVIRGSFASIEDVGALVVGKISNSVAGAGAKRSRKKKKKKKKKKKCFCFFLVARICWGLHGEWKAEAARSQLSLPRLQSVDWRVDVKTASGHAGGMGVPSVIVQLRVEPDQVVSFEMDKETLQALLSGLGKIRSQLSGL